MGFVRVTFRISSSCFNFFKKNENTLLASLSNQKNAAGRCVVGAFPTFAPLRRTHKTNDVVCTRIIRCFSPCIRWHLVSLQGKTGNNTSLGMLSFPNRTPFLRLHVARLLCPSETAFCPLMHTVTPPCRPRAVPGNVYTWGTSYSKFHHETTQSPRAFVQGNSGRALRAPS